MDFSPLCIEDAMNDAAPIHSIDQCDMSGLLEDLKFRNIQQDASKSGKKSPSTSRSSDRKKGSPRLSIRKVGFRLRDSFQRKSNRDRSTTGSWDSLSAEIIDDEFDDMALNFQQPSDISVSKREEETPKKDTSAKLSWRSDSEIVWIHSSCFFQSGDTQVGYSSSTTLYQQLCKITASL